MARKFFTSERLLNTFLKLLTVSTLATCFTCETPDDWLTGDITIQQPNQNQHQEHTDNVAAQNILQRGVTWPNVVKYKLHSSLSSNDISEVQKAFDEYHSKTCIRFQPWQDGDVDFVSIEVDNEVCGLGHVCKIGGYQFAKFGKNCRNKATMIHELGHTLCLGHEHQRTDRDNYLRFSGCQKTPRTTESFRPSGIYDFASQMHYECGHCGGGWPKPATVDLCGTDATPGLSVLDVDSINSLYNCQGCKRHRWIPAASVSARHNRNLFDFGYKSRNGQPIYPCRTSINGEVASGMFDKNSKSCKISYGYSTHEITEQVEVLTIPGGLSGDDCSSYQLENWRHASVQDLVDVGTTLRNDYRNMTSHVAYASFTGNDGVAENYAGKVWLPNKRFHFSAEFAVGTQGLMATDYQVLTCKFDSTCSARNIWQAK